MTGWERLGHRRPVARLPFGRLSPSAVLDDAPAGIAVIVGLTRSHEFGWSITIEHPSGAGTRNP
jgi:hypothetical protein